MIIKNVVDRFLLGGYAAEKDEATDRIVKRQSRGNVAAQNGWYLSRSELEKNSRRADKSMKALEKLLHRAS